jgi:hypothetical protein
MPQEMMVTCPYCHQKNQLHNRATNGTYKCSHCQCPFSDRLVSSSKRQKPALPIRSFSLTRIESISILTVLGLLILVRSYWWEGHLSSPLSDPLTSSSSTASPTLPSLTLKPEPAPTPKPVQKPTDDHGVPFPSQSGYLKGYPVLAVGGYSSVTVDNSQNDSDVFVKLFSLDMAPPKAASVFFIRAHDTFTVEDIKPGTYDVRYRDLTSGTLSRTEPLNLREVETANGVEFSRLTVTLYKVRNGNMQVQPISNNEF